MRADPAQARCPQMRAHLEYLAAHHLTARFLELRPVRSCGETGWMPEPRGGIVLVKLTPKPKIGTHPPSWAASFCSPLDNFDRRKGKLIALGRAVHVHRQTLYCADLILTGRFAQTGEFSGPDLGDGIGLATNGWYVDETGAPNPFPTWGVRMRDRWKLQDLWQHDVLLDLLDGSAR